jgi:tRNA/tmRNA/rRNA uracil-C5-methylase (TrmA/RlmC/RlmD family)
MRYATQVLSKTDLVRSQLIQGAKISDPPVRPCLPSLHAYGYRNSAQFRLLPTGHPAYPAANQMGKPSALIAVDECPILEPVLQEALQQAAASGVAGKEEWNLRLPDRVDVGNFSYFVGAQSLFQVNTPMTEQLVEVVIGALEPGADQMFLDLFCGVGLFTLPLAVMSADVIGVEPDAAAARDARRNIASIRNRLYNKVPPRILTEGVDRALGRPEIKARRTAGVVVTAPGSGLNLKICTQIAKLGAQRLVYVGSEPETLARDLKALISAGYRLDYVQPLDMRPQTHHVHAVARLSLG